MREILKRHKTLIFLLAILAIASFFRLWQLDKIPPGLYPDVAIYGNDGLDTFQTGNFKVFYPENNGREGLFMWLLAVSFLIFGVSIWSIKIVAAIIGILTVLGLYLLTKELFKPLRIIHPVRNQRFSNGAGLTELRINNSEAIALLASFFLAISFWHVNFSRIGFRAILVPFILVFAFYFLLKGFNQLNRRHQQNYITLYSSVGFILAGIFFGLGFYTYISYRFIILLLPLVLISFWFIYKKEKLQKKYLFFIFYFLIFIFIVALPIGIYFLQNPQYFVSRAAGVSVFTQENPIKSFFFSLAAHLAMFNFYGDPNWRHNFSGSPMLFWPIGILFLIGIILSIRDLISSIKNKNWSLLVVSYLLLSWFFIMLLPGILTAEGIPHALRVIGVIPVVYIFAGLGGWKVYQWFEQNIKNKKLLLMLISLFLLLMIFREFDKYFNKWGKNPEVKNAFSADYVEMGNYLNSLPEGIEKYVVVNRPGVPVPWPDGIPMPAQTIMFIENTKYRSLKSTYLLPENMDQIKIDNKEVVIMPMKYDENLAADLKKRFPQGEIKQINEIWLYELK